MQSDCPEDATGSSKYLLQWIVSNTKTKHSFITNAVLTDVNACWRLYLCTHDVSCARNYIPISLHAEKQLFHNDVHTLCVSYPLCTYVPYRLWLSDYCSFSTAVRYRQNLAVSSYSISLESGFIIGSAYLKTLVPRCLPCIQSHVAECQQQMIEQPDDTLDRHPNKTKQFVLTRFSRNSLLLIRTLLSRVLMTIDGVWIGE
jgi:hypothetical protein